MESPLVAAKVALLDMLNDRVISADGDYMDDEWLVLLQRLYNERLLLVRHYMRPHLAQR